MQAQAAAQTESRTKEAEVKLHAENQDKATAEAKAKADNEARAKAQAEATADAEVDAQIKANLQAKARQRAEAKAKATPVEVPSLAKRREDTVDQVRQDAESAARQGAVGAARATAQASSPSRSANPQPATGTANRRGHTATDNRKSVYGFDSDDDSEPELVLSPPVQANGASAPAAAGKTSTKPTSPGASTPLPALLEGTLDRKVEYDAGGKRPTFRSWKSVYCICSEGQLSIRNGPDSVGACKVALFVSGALTLFACRHPPW